MTNLERLEKVDVRSQWQNEEYDFTPWLAKESNIQVLSDEIGLDLEVEDTEVYIGSYKADIVARDGEGRKVIIENQLSKTDHKHLGQLITYAFGIEARIGIWICKEVTDEHRRALDWLNEVADGSRCFLSSANLTGHAMEKNMEAGVLIEGGQIPRQSHGHLSSLVTTGVVD